MDKKCDTKNMKKMDKSMDKNGGKSMSPQDKFKAMIAAKKGSKKGK